jgi:hypothetical protein
MPLMPSTAQYCRFKDDDQLRRALATKVRWLAIAEMVRAICGGRENMIGGIQWLMNLRA